MGWEGKKPLRYPQFSTTERRKDYCNVFNVTFFMVSIAGAGVPKAGEDFGRI